MFTDNLLIMSRAPSNQEVTSFCSDLFGEAMVVRKISGFSKPMGLHPQALEEDVRSPLPETE